MVSETFQNAMKATEKGLASTVLDAPKKNRNRRKSPDNGRGSACRPYLILRKVYNLGKVRRLHEIRQPHEIFDTKAVTSRVTSIQPPVKPSTVQAMQSLAILVF